MKDFKKLCNDYIEEKKLQGARETTLQNISRVLSLFYSFAQKNGIDPLERTAFSEWRENMKKKRIKNGTIHFYFVVLHGFFEYCQEKEEIENPLSGYKAPKAQKSNIYTNLLSVEEIKSLLNPDRVTGARRKTWARNYAIIVLLITTSIRNSELRSLRPADISEKNGAILVEEGKGGKSRILSAPSICFHAINQYMEERPSCLTEYDWLFGIEENGWHQISRIGLSEMVNRHVALVTGRKGIRSHAMRHVSASIMVSNGVNMRAIQGQLGHESYRTTEIYAQILQNSVATRETTAIFDKLMGVE